jgi:hypothetical protein
MLRWLCVVLLALTAAASAYTNVSACGDKFLRVGRSARFRGYASVHPSSILVYAPRWTRRGVADFEKMLKRGGHSPVTVTTAGAMSQAFAAGKYDVVITAFTDVDDVKRELDSMMSTPAILPLLYNATKAQTTAAAATYRHVLKPDTMTPLQALEEIDRLVDLKLKNVVETSAAR